MEAYVVIGILALAMIVILLIATTRMQPPTKLSGLSAIAFAFVVAGIIFGESRAVGYSLIGIGLLNAVADIIRQKMRT